MKYANLLFFVLACLAVFSMCAIGISIAESSVLGGIASFAGVIIFMGTGFYLKRKHRETVS
ncbi:DUF5325 family protein [Pseudalkalibacillus caeni]|uniref:DUF5325 family protein n=1 Tax=Exobacillus caeni TaxID=2574798 RepID=A0A5R9F216_9BACL|nr:DUF5325 family protein [Pseudalkalibacillus caeni]TLS37682.1 hypothetical protein FCL54_07605 [Pseudalkalibacillus caeni]